VAKQLVIVESPTKAKTLERYLGSDYSVTASRGHVRDLPEDRMGVEVDDSFTPEYVIPQDKAQTVDHLRKAYKGSAGLWLATDFDREGEAIAWHVAESIGADPKTANRVTFTEITRDAIQQAFRDPRRIDFDLVDAQQARRVLDRIVGYELSPLLSKRLRRALSAGRVQSVALRLIVDREREIRAFTPVEYWSVDARLTPQAEEQPFLARLIHAGDEKLASSPDKKGILLSTEEDAQRHVDALGQASYRVAEVRQREAKRTPAPPFTTSTLQQEAARKLGFSARKTMQIAQRLYEGVNVPGEGQVGLITYMRTDSVNIAEQALGQLTELVTQLYGPQYALAEPRRYRKKQRGAQEAHEAIRPTGAHRTPDALGPVLDPNQLRLYRLIWQRTVASQMAEARFDQVSVDVEAKAAEPLAYLLRATGQTLVFDGFRRVYFEGRDDTEDEDAEHRLPRLSAEQLLRLIELLPEQHFTQPAPRYSEASLVKALEENGIGRPSTYAPTISTLLDRNYVRLEDKRFFPEDIGELVTDTLVDNFSDIFDIGFTSRMEEELDDIAEGKMGWVEALRDFYGPFHEDVERAEGKIQPYEKILPELCPRCPEEGRVPPGHLVEKLGRFGKFIGCENYPECTYTREVEGAPQRPEPEPTGETCPQCGRGELVKRFGRFGPFIGCSRYPECKYIKKEKPRSTGVTCPKCKQGELVERKGRFGSFYSCDRYPDCDFSVNQEPQPKPCPNCEGLVVAARGGATRCIACGKAWDAEGSELPEEEAQKLIPKPRAPRGAPAGGGSHRGRRSRARSA
jgi:DNA topoisomerase-1